MVTYWIVVGFMIYLKSHKSLMNILNIKQSNRNSIIYTLFGFLLPGILLLVNFDSTNKGSALVFIFYVLGLSIQICYWYYKKPTSIKWPDSSS